MHHQGHKKKLDQEVAELEPDHNGLFSVCFSRKDANYSEMELYHVFGAAGEVRAIYFTERLTFVRYGSKKEIIKCLHMYKDEYQLNLGKAKKDTNTGDGYETDSKSRNRKRVERTSKTINSGHSKSTEGMPHDSKGKKDNHEVNETGDYKKSHKSAHSKDAFTNGPADDRSESNINANIRGNHVHRGKQESELTAKKWTSKDADSTQASNQLFAYNIESRELFESMLKDHKPKQTKFVDEGNKKYAFLSMAKVEDAERLIEDLNGQFQNTRKLFVRYKDKPQIAQDDVSVKSSCNELSPPERATCKKKTYNEAPPPLEKVSSKERARTKPDRMPSLEVDYSDMPSLIKDSSVYDPDGRYDVDCRVHVTHFPFQCLLSELREAFKEPIVDICMINNGEAGGCTKAVLHMATIYDALQVLREMDNSTPFGHPPIRVYPDPENVLLRHILMRDEVRRL